MLQSRKIVCVKLIVTSSSDIYVKANIKKFYGHESRPAIILFCDGIPKKAHCKCPVGTSGLCCHVLALLLFLKHYADTKEKLLELTCTEKLQKWQRQISKGSIPMIPLKEIKLRLAKMRKKTGNIASSAADPHDSYFKRDVSSISSVLSKKLDDEKPVTEHFYSVLSKYEAGRNSSLGQLLTHKFEKRKACLADHGYTRMPLFDKKVIFVDNEKMKRIQNIINNDCNE